MIIGQPITAVKVQLIGTPSNAFSILGKVRKALIAAGHEDLVPHYLKDATESDYDHLLQVTMCYVHVE